METVSSLQWSNLDPDKASPRSHLFLYLSEQHLNLSPASGLCNSGSPIALCVCVCKGKGKGKVIPLQARCDPEGG